MFNIQSLKAKAKTAAEVCKKHPATAAFGAVTLVLSPEAAITAIAAGAAYASDKTVFGDKPAVESKPDDRTWAQAKDANAEVVR